MASPQNRRALAKPAVTVTPPLPGAPLDRAQTPMPAAQSQDTEKVNLTLDGRPVEAGAPLDLTGLAAAEHTHPARRAPRTRRSAPWPWAKVQSGKGLAADRAALIASDARDSAAAS